MPSTRDIRQRIRGVRNIRQITRAMNMIAAARLRRAQGRLEAAQPYAERLAAVLSETLAAAGKARHPLLLYRPVRRIGLVVITSDRGLCGPFNAAILREAGRFADEQTVEVGLITVGRKAREFFQRMGIGVDRSFPQPSPEVRPAELYALREAILRDYTDGLYDRVHLAYARFVSALKSEPRIVQLLPVQTATVAAGVAEPLQPQFEPAAEQLLDALLAQYVESVVRRALLESLASEQAARMIAMKAATDSATEMIETLTREYNRARQTAITTQILEVVSGAEALRQQQAQQ